VTEKLIERLAVGDNAPALTLIDSEGNAVALADIWAKGNTIITFLRHFG
jgi:peroxiredoxin